MGWLFLYSVHHIAHSPFVRNFVQLVLQRVLPSRSHDANDLEANSPTTREKEMKWIEMRRDSETSAGSEEVGHGAGDFTTLAFTLTLCFAFASIANFGSLLEFNPVGGDSACGA